MASRTTRVRQDSASSISSVGSDNADANIRKAKAGVPLKTNKTFAQRTRSALGDIGNRVLKKPSAEGEKQVGTMKAAGSTKSIPGDLKSGENFVVPVARAPRAACRQENQVSQKAIVRSNSVNVPGRALKPVVKLYPDAKAVVSSKLQRSQSTHLRTKDSDVLNLQNKGIKETKQISEACSNLSEVHISNKDKENIESEIIERSKKLSETDEILPDESVTLFEKTEEKTDGNNSKDNAVVAVEANADVGFSAKRYEVPDVDAVDEGNPLLVKEYIQDICNYLFRLEKRYPIRIRYLEGRLVNSRMRAVLLDWLVEVHHQFGFMPETLYLASKTMDRYLQKERRVTRKQLQLVGVTSMYIAAKFEEVCTPTVQDFSAVSDNAFSAEEVRDMEREMLISLNYDLAPPPAVFFLRRFSKVAGVNNGTAPMLIHAMAKYIMELTMVDYSTCHLYPSEQAAASLALSMLILERKKSLRELWTPTMEHYSCLECDSLKQFITPIANILGKIHEEPPKLKAVFNKYARNRLSRVSLTPELDVAEWKNRVLKELC